MSGISKTDSLAFPVSVEKTLKPVKSLDQISLDVMTGNSEIKNKGDFVQIQLATDNKLNNKPQISFIEENFYLMTPNKKEFSDNHDLLKTLEKSNVEANIIDYDPDKHVDASIADFFYVNGIQTDKTSAEHSAKLLTGIMNKEVKPIWSERESFTGDLSKALQIDNGNDFGKTSSKTEGDIRSNVIKSLTNGRNVKLVAHSRGTSEVANALWDVRSRLAISGYKTEEINEMMKKVEVIALGTLAAPSDFPYDIKLTRINNPDDPVSKLNQEKELKGNSRARYSKTEIDISVAEKTAERPLDKGEKISLYAKNINYTEKSELKVKLSALGKNFAPSVYRNAFSSTSNALYTRTLGYIPSALAVGKTHLLNSGESSYLGMQTNVWSKLREAATDSIPKKDINM